MNQVEERNVPTDPVGKETSAAQVLSPLASSPRDFIASYAARFNMSPADLDDMAIEYLIGRMENGATRFEILDAMKRLQGERPFFSAGEPILDRARAGVAQRALIVENVTGFSPENDQAFVNHAFGQVLARHPSPPERVRLCHELKTGAMTREGLLNNLTRLARMEGYNVEWDSLSESSSERDDSSADALLTVANRTVDKSGRVIVPLCERTADGWTIGDTVDVRIIDAYDGGWRFKPGCFIDGSRTHLQPGVWRVDISVAQPEESEISLSVLANVGLSELLSVNFRGDILASFVFEKQPAHTFLQVRLNSVGHGESIGWASLQHLRLVKIGER